MILRQLKKVELYQLIGFSLFGINFLGCVYIAVNKLLTFKTSFFILLTNTYFILCFSLGILFLTSAAIKKLRFIQPLATITLALYFMIVRPNEYISLVYFIVGISLLIKYNFFKKAAWLKIVIIFILLAGSGLLGGFFNSRSVSSAIELPFVITCLFFIMYAIFHENLDPHLYGKPKFNLSSVHITFAEAKIINEAIKGSNIKAISFNLEKNNNTTKAQLNSIYKKLQVVDWTTFQLFLERHEVINDIRLTRKSQIYSK